MGKGPKNAKPQAATIVGTTPGPRVEWKDLQVASKTSPYTAAIIHLYISVSNSNKTQGSGRNSKHLLRESILNQPPLPPKKKKGKCTRNFCIEKKKKKQVSTYAYTVKVHHVNYFMKRTFKLHSTYWIATTMKISFQEFMVHMNSEGQCS